MGFFYEHLLRPVLFRMDAEHAHERSVKAMSLLGRLPPVRRAVEAWNRPPAPRRRPIRAMGLEFPNAVGLAAGFDKNALAWPAAAALGFGHVEIGSVTALAQPGNPAPRLLRYPAQEAVINRMGFNNVGAVAVAARLRSQGAKKPGRIPLGINLGKSKSTAIEDAARDYLASFALLADLADYVVLNVSSPNTPGLRRLQDEERLRELVGAIQGANRARPEEKRVPVLLKIAPDLTFHQVDAVLGVIAEFGLDGIIATNTTLDRPGFFGSVNEPGGLSGAPLRRRATEMVRYIAKATAGRLPIVGVGGITDIESASEKLDAGAVLIQVYTGMIFRGPFFARDLALALAAR